MSKRGDLDYIKDIRESLKRIESYKGNMSYSEFLLDYKTQDAIVRNIEIVGEAAKNISEKFKQEHPQIPWHELAGVRDRLIHHYFGVNYDIVWGIATDEVPRLIKEIDKILK